MKTNKLTMAALVLFFAGLLYSCCKDSVSELTVSVTPDKLTLSVGEDATLLGVVNGVNAKMESWHSTNPEIATVDENGLVRAISLGQCDIMATYKDKFASCKLTVIEGSDNPPTPTPPVIPDGAEINFIWDEILLGIGGEFKLSVIHTGFEDVNYDVNNLSWEVGDATIARVSSSGMVHALSAGSTILTASYGDLTATCSIKVSEGYDITVPDGITLRVGETKTVNSDEFTSQGGSYTFRYEMSDDGYYASLPDVQVVIANSVNVNVGSGGQLNPEFKYSGLKLIGKHEGTTTLRIYNEEIGFEALIPVTVLPE
jgi:hypothetical protein